MHYRRPKDQLISRVLELNWLLIILVLGFSFTGVALLYSAASGGWEPWALKQFYVVAIFGMAMVIIGLTDLSFFYRNAYMMYFFGVLLLLVAEIIGHKAMGAQRWIKIGPVNFQPSELMKIFVILALSKYYHDLYHDETGKIKSLLFPLIVLGIPVLLILKQPNLGTASITVMIAGTIFFMAGVRLWKFAVVIGGVILMMPIVWMMMHDYQKQRVLTFLNPESDPLGAGYNIIQSMIAIGSGGTWGKGFISGTQSQLNFLPEKQTDFVFTILAEEFGFMGVATMFLLSMFICVIGYMRTLSVDSQFARLVIVGVISMFALHVIVNTAMIAGLMPVVGTPFPFFSFGGSNLITMLIGFGIVLSASSKYNQKIH